MFQLRCVDRTERRSERRSTDHGAVGRGRLGCPSSSGAAKQYTIGYSNGGGVGNGFREEQVCTAKAQAQGAPARSPT